MNIKELPPEFQALILCLEELPEDHRYFTAFRAFLEKYRKDHTDAALVAGLGDAERQYAAGAAAGITDLQQQFLALHAAARRKS